MWKRQWKWLKEHIQGRELSIVMVIHFGSMLLCGLIFVLLPDDVHLRWGLTYGLIWVALLSPIALMIAARKSRRKVVIRLYSALIGIALWLLAVFLQLIGGDIFLPATCFCKDGDYLVGEDGKPNGIFTGNGCNIAKRLIPDFSLEERRKILLETMEYAVAMDLQAFRATMWERLLWTDLLHLSSSTISTIREKALLDIDIRFASIDLRILRSTLRMASMLMAIILMIHG